MVYFVTGPSGVGKTSFSTMIKNTYNVDFFDTGPILREIYKNSNSNQSFSSWIRENEDRYGAEFAISSICKKMFDTFNNQLTTIIIGNRSIDGINYMIRNLNIQNYCIVYLDADFECLKTNIENREKIYLSDEDFERIIRSGNEMGLLNLKEFVLSNPNFCYYYYKHQNENLKYLNIYKVITSKMQSDSKKNGRVK